MLLVLRGLPPRPNRVVGKVRLLPSSRVIRRRLLLACKVLASVPGLVTLVGCCKRPPEDKTTLPKRPSWKYSVKERVSAKVVRIPSKASKTCG